jgi:hypothetical protein
MGLERLPALGIAWRIGSGCMLATLREYTDAARIVGCRRNRTNDLDGRLALLEVGPVQLEARGEAHVRTIATERREIA